MGYFRFWGINSVFRIVRFINIIFKIYINVGMISLFYGLGRWFLEKGGGGIGFWICKVIFWNECENSDWINWGWWVRSD